VVIFQLFQPEGLFCGENQGKRMDPVNDFLLQLLRERECIALQTDREVSLKPSERPTLTTYPAIPFHDDPTFHKVDRGVSLSISIIRRQRGDFLFSRWVEDLDSVNFW